MMECRICGNLFIELRPHLKKHKISIHEYKIKYSEKSDNMLEKVFVGTTYQNIKNKKLYIVTGIGFHTELEETTVRYIPLYKSEHKEYYRPLEGPKGFKNKFIKH